MVPYSEISTLDRAEHWFRDYVEYNGGSRAAGVNGYTRGVAATRGASCEGAALVETPKKLYIQCGGAQAVECGRCVSEALSRRHFAGLAMPPSILSSAFSHRTERAGARSLVHGSPRIC